MKNNDVKRVVLGDVLHLLLDEVPVDPLREYMIAGVYSFARGLLARGPLAGSSTTYKKLNRLHRGDFVISEPKAWEGAIAKVTESFDGWYVSPVFPTFRADSEQLDINYLDWYCKQSNVWERLRFKSRGIGARRETVSPDQFLSIEIPLPPLENQRRIVERIEELAAKIEEAKGLRREGRKESDLLMGAVTSKLFDKVGSKVQQKKLRELTSRITKGESPSWQGFSYQDSGPMFIRSENVLWGKIDLSQKVHIPEAFHEKLSRSKVLSGDVLINLVGASIGRVCVVPEGVGDANVNQAVAVITVNTDTIDPEYLVDYILNPTTQDVIHGGKVETARPNISLDDLKKLSIPLPLLEEQRHIVEELKKVNLTIESLKHLQGETSKELDALLPSVLDKAFKGEL